PVGRDLPQPGDAPRVVVPVDRPDHRQPGFGKDERAVVEVMEAEVRGDPGEEVAVHAQGVAAGVVRADPDVVVTGGQRLATGEIGERLQAGGELLGGPDVAGQDEQVGWVREEVGDQGPGGVPPGRVAGAPVQVGGHSDGGSARAHAVL